MEATRIAINERIVMGLVKSSLMSSKPPVMMIPLIALVTDIKGVCNEWVTFQITFPSNKTARTKAVMCPIKSEGATLPKANSTTPIMVSQIILETIIF